LKENALTAGYHGCTAEVTDCNSYHFKWDIERYKVDRKWFKTFWKCNGCTAGKVLTADGSACVANTNLGNCAKAENADNCAECNATYFITTDNNKKVCKK
jgi:hypothetical protein